MDIAGLFAQDLSGIYFKISAKFLYFLPIGSELCFGPPIFFSGDQGWKTVLDKKIKKQKGSQIGRPFVPVTFIRISCYCPNLYFYNFNKPITVDLHVTAKNSRRFVPGSCPIRIRIRLRSFNIGKLDFILSFFLAFSNAISAFSFTFACNISF
jgi:hypothetical protein